MDASDIALLKKEWLSKWRSADFSWHGKALNTAENPNSYNYSVLRPHGFPETAPQKDGVRGVSGKDYWRWSLGLPGPSRLLDDDELNAYGLLAEHDGVLYHLIHAPTHDKFNARLEDMITARAELSAEHARDKGKAKRPVMLHLDGAWLPSNVLGLCPPGTSISARKAHIEILHSEGTLGALICREARFSGTVLLTGAEMKGEMDFSSALFEQDVWINEAKVGGEATLARSTFLNSADLSETEFVENLSLGGSHFRKSLSLSMTTCCQDLWAAEAHIAEAAYLDALKVHGRAWIDRCRFEGPCDFRSAVCHGMAGFSGTSFLSNVSFAGCEFEGPTSFAGVTWPAIPIDDAFSETRFRDRANFRNENPLPVSAFNHVTFDVPPAFSEPEDARTFDQQFRAACWMTRLANKANSKRDSSSEEFNILDVERSADARWASLSGGYRTLKNIARAHGNFLLEQTYYRYEIKSRMKRPQITLWEKMVAGLYSLVSDYGNSISRPFATLFTGLVGFTLAYFLIAVTAGPSTPLMSQGMEQLGWQSWEFSWNNTFRPLSALATDAPREGDASRLSGQLMYNYGGGVAALTRALATLQSLLSVVLTFLFALAVRRRFQIDA